MAVIVGTKVITVMDVIAKVIVAEIVMAVTGA